MPLQACRACPRPDQCVTALPRAFIGSKKRPIAKRPVEDILNLSAGLEQLQFFCQKSGIYSEIKYHMENPLF